MSGRPVRGRKHRFLLPYACGTRLDMIWKRFLVRPPCPYPLRAIFSSKIDDFLRIRGFPLCLPLCSAVQRLVGPNPENHEFCLHTNPFYFFLEVLQVSKHHWAEDHEYARRFVGQIFSPSSLAPTPTVRKCPVRIIYPFWAPGGTKQRDKSGPGGLGGSRGPRGAMLVNPSWTLGPFWGEKGAKRVPKMVPRS